jgi:hypothetical protein
VFSCELADHRAEGPEICRNRSRAGSCGGDLGDGDLGDGDLGGGDLGGGRLGHLLGLHRSPCRIADDGERRADTHGVSLGHEYLHQRAGGRRRDLRVDLVGGDLEQDLVLGDHVAYLLGPPEDRPFRDSLPELGHGDRDRHCVPPTCL